MNAINNPYQNYRRTQIETADQATLLLMLYSGALKNLKASRKAMEENNIEEVNHQLGKAQDILCELMGSLNPDVPEISSNLFQLYEYMHYQLVQANIKKDAALVGEVEKMINTLLEAWQAAIDSEKADLKANADKEGTERVTSVEKKG